MITNQFQRFLRVATYSAILLITTSCAAYRTSKFSYNTVKEGMSENEVSDKYGKPYRTGFSKNQQGESLEDWYYRENLYLGEWYSVTTVIHFKDQKVVSMEPGKERRLRNGVTVEND